VHRRISFFQAPGIEVAVRSIDAPLKNFTPPSELKNALGRALIANDSTTASLQFGHCIKRTCAEHACVPGHESPRRDSRFKTESLKTPEDQIADN
jgi:hypothetical protein